MGKPFNQVKTKIIDREIYIGGPILCNGYVKKDENRNAFKIINKINYYKTNDIVMKKSGVYIVKGRNDNVVKILGYRVDLFDVDNNLRKINKINNCFVFTLEKNDNEPFICAAIESNKISENKIIKNLKNKLSNYMIPKKILIFKKFPINKNNKIDRTAIKKFFN